VLFLHGMMMDRWLKDEIRSFMFVRFDGLLLFARGDSSVFSMTYKSVLVILREEIPESIRLLPPDPVPMCM